MKKAFFAAAAFLASCLALAATTAPVQLLSPAGSTAGQAVVSTGPSSAPGWATVTAGSVTPIAANSVYANFTGSSASPIANAVPSCSTANSALKYTSATGLSCGTTFALTSGNLSQFAATTSAQLAGVLSDETGGSGVAVFNASPTFTGTVNVAALTATGAITPSQTVGIVGTTTNNNANAGSFGEYATNATTGTSLTTGVAANATSVNLTAGDWDATCTATFIPAGSTTMSSLNVGITTTSATFAGTNTGSSTALIQTFTTGSTQAFSAPGAVRLSLSGTTTAYCVVQAAFATSTMTVNGFIRARRVR